MGISAISVVIYWIPKEIGGHSGPPWDGMRPRYRSQKFFDQTVGDLAVSVRDITKDQDIGMWKALIEFPLGADEPVVEVGSQFELLDGHRVLAIGLVRKSHSNS